MTVKVAPATQEEVSKALLGKTVKAVFYKTVATGGVVHQTPETGGEAVLDSILFTDGTWLLFNRDEQWQNHLVIPTIGESV